jgi:hypothetical protein
MSAIRLRFACGHSLNLEATDNQPPNCPTCGEKRVQRTFAPPPRFTGFCSGPNTQMKALEPFAAPLKGDRS